MPQSVDQIPPLLNSTRGRERDWTASVLFAAIVAGIIGAKVSAHIQLPFLRCLFKEITGLPCAFCGSTRAFRSLGNLEGVEAFMWNPLSTLAALGIVVWFVMSISVSGETMKRIEMRVKRSASWPLVLLAVTLNWIFLILHLPR